MLAVTGSIERLCSPAIWAEGPVWLADQQCLIFSDVKGNRMFRWDAQNGVSVFRAEPTLPTATRGTYKGAC